jgi:amino-acid N-acetyltransferase
VLLVTGKTTISIRPATPGDRSEVERLLVENDLPTAGVHESLEGFLVAENDGTIVGAIGLERYGPYGLLRSAVVSPAARGKGVGRELVAQLLDSARANGVEGVYLLTTTAENYFPSFGFARVDRSTVPAEIQRSVEFAEACPSSATVMARSLHVKGM